MPVDFSTLQACTLACKGAGASDFMFQTKFSCLALRNALCCCTTTWLRCQKHKPYQKPNPTAGIGTPAVVVALYALLMHHIMQHTANLVIVQVMHACLLMDDCTFR